MTQQPPNWGTPTPPAQPTNAFQPQMPSGYQPHGFQQMHMGPKFTSDDLPDPEWINTIKNGIVLFLVYLGVYVLYGILVGISTLILPAESYHIGFGFMQLLALIPLGFLFMSLYKMATADPVPTMLINPEYTKYLRIGLFGTLAFQVLLLAFVFYFLLNNNTESVMLSHGEYAQEVPGDFAGVTSKTLYMNVMQSHPAFYLLTMLASILMLVVYVFLTLHMIGVCNRLKLNKMSTQVKISFWGLVISFALSIPFQALTSAMSLSDPQTVQMIGCGNILPGLGVIGFGVYVIVIFCILISKLSNTRREVIDLKRYFKQMQTGSPQH